ncbi:MAG: hypothetical protein AAF318_16820 [Pseudomonadota bacterium]
MRTIAAALMCAMAWMGQPANAIAADLDHRPTYNCTAEKPQYYGVYEPYSRRSERPPRRGVWYYTQPQPPAVNFLVPMAGGLCLRPKPWTPAWFAYCRQKWPSFNPRTGTIQTPDGVRMCV